MWLVVKTGERAMWVWVEDGAGEPVGGVRAAISLAAAGDMGMGIEGTPAREVWCREVGVEGVRCVRQVHGRRVVDAGEAGVEADGLVAQEEGVVCGVTVADCVPVWAWRMDGGAWGVAHSGWRGTGIAGELVRRLGGEGVVAVVGPSIRACCYRVDEERARWFERAWGEGAVVWREEGPYLDLAAVNRRLCREAGARVFVVDACTACDTRFGSFRREGTHFTHMLAIIGKITHL
ncbi:polyphenol oxidase family protein [Spirochaeta thermophila]|uniref:Putative inner membrane protein n=1 Tax=Winmispira thermophila (strain ATCC 49972 / DSM 6192 / RI 19.B1) TaxID=665571 RepID=E0RSI1_WINT6|nr:polyphenol oxidase family protein [Spirochaeta thermophila]ADN01968.1 putative inner membrane protein [Spirochaeta thermophila DSM 6192]